MKRLGPVILLCVIIAGGCKPTDFTWKDTTGRNRDICMAISDMNYCDELTGVNKHLGNIEWQMAMQHRDQCMNRRGWLLADSWESEQEEAAEVTKCRKPDPLHAR